MPSSGAAHKITWRKFILYILSIDGRNFGLFETCDMKTHKEVCGKGKGKVHPRTGHEGPEVE